MLTRDVTAEPVSRDQILKHVPEVITLFKYPTDDFCELCDTYNTLQRFYVSSVAP